MPGSSLALAGSHPSKCWSSLKTGILPPQALPQEPSSALPAPRNPGWIKPTCRVGWAAGAKGRGRQHPSVLTAWMVLHCLQVVVLEDPRMTQTDLVTPAASWEEIEFSQDILQQFYWSISLAHCGHCPCSWLEQWVLLDGGSWLKTDP